MNKSILIFLLAAFSCARSEKEGTRELLNPQAAAEMLQADPGVILIDVRTPEELSSGIIAGATNLNYNSAQFQSSLDSLDVSKTYLLYCASGKRSSKAQQLMKEKGFDHIFSIEGGMNAWVTAGLPVTKP